MTQVFLTTGDTNPWPTPGDWNNSDNSVELIGRGGNGSAGTTGSNRLPGSGGGGGAYRKRVNLTLSGNNYWRVGTSASAVTTRFGNDGTNGTNYFGAQFGTDASGTTPGSGGVVTEETGGSPPGSSPSGFAGGNGAGSANKTYGGGAGGGAGGPNGDGAAGNQKTFGGGGGGGGGGANGGGGGATSGGLIGDGNYGGYDRTSTYRGLFGTGDATSGQATTNGGGGGGGGAVISITTLLTGGDGSTDGVWNSTHGPGSGGGATGDASKSSGLSGNFQAGNGGLYGGGGGGVAGTRQASGITPVPGTGASGLIAITYAGAAETITVDKWIYGLSIPVMSKTEMVEYGW